MLVTHPSRARLYTQGGGVVPNATPFDFTGSPGHLLLMPVAEPFGDARESLATGGNEREYCAGRAAVG
jgi:hypothetical protein